MSLYYQYFDGYYINSIMGQPYLMHIIADERIATRCQHEVDPVWKIQWRPANISALDGQPCPTVNGRVATGKPGP